MNRKERRMLDKMSQKDQIEILLKTTRSISEELDITQKLVTIADGNIAENQVPESVDEINEKIITTLEKWGDLFPMIRDRFLCDEKCKNGFNKKSIVNALSMPMYKAKLDNYVRNIRKNKRNSPKDIVEYLICHDLSADRTEVKRTLDVLENSIPVVIDNLRANNIKNIVSLPSHLATLARRLYHLYCLYGYYLEDTGNIVEYQVMYQLFDQFDNAFTSLMHIASNEH